MRVEGNTAVVTGGGSGLARSLARYLGQEGADRCPASSTTEGATQGSPLQGVWASGWHRPPAR
jgi:NAD(P)-dependent dehydrogenase (short-subunit alcohol dehydrogenase family)